MKKMFVVLHKKVKNDHPVGVFSNRKILWENLQKEYGEKLYHDFHENKKATYVSLFNTRSKRLYCALLLNVAFVLYGSG